MILVMSVLENMGKQRERKTHTEKGDGREGGGKAERVVQTKRK